MLERQKTAGEVLTLIPPRTCVLERLGFALRWPRMLFNERKLATLRYFARREWTSPAAWAVDAGFYPIRSSYSYLKHLHKWKLLHRGHDVRGRVVYRLSPHGARWLLRRDRLSVRS